VGQLGHGDQDCRQVPQPIASLEKTEVLLFATSGAHSLLLTQNGVHSFGWNQSGQLGIGNQDNSMVPKKITELSRTKIKDFSCGGAHSLVVDGRLLLSLRRAEMVNTID